MDKYTGHCHIWGGLRPKGLHHIANSNKFLFVRTSDLRVRKKGIKEGNFRAISEEL